MQNLDHISVRSILTHDVDTQMKSETYIKHGDTIVWETRGE